MKLDKQVNKLAVSTNFVDLQNTNGKTTTYLYRNIFQGRVSTIQLVTIAPVTRRTLQQNNALLSLLATINITVA